MIPCPALQSREHLDKVMDWFRNREDSVREVILVVTDTPKGAWNTVRDVEAVILGRGWIWCVIVFFFFFFYSFS